MAVVNESAFINQTTGLGNITVNYTQLAEEIWNVSNRTVTEFNVADLSGGIMSSMPLLTLAVLAFGFLIMAEWKKDIFYSLTSGTCFFLFGFWVLKNQIFKTDSAFLHMGLYLIVFAIAFWVMFGVTYQNLQANKEKEEKKAARGKG